MREKTDRKGFLIWSSIFAAAAVLGPLLTSSGSAPVEEGLTVAFLGGLIGSIGKVVGGVAGAVSKVAPVIPGVGGAVGAVAGAVSAVLKGGSVTATVPAQGSGSPEVYQYGAPAPAQAGMFGDLGNMKVFGLPLIPIALIGAVIFFLRRKR